MNYKLESFIFDDEKMELLYREIGHNINKQRTTKGLSLEKLGELANLPKSQIWHVEQGDVKYRSDVLFKIVAALDITINEVLPFHEKRYDLPPTNGE